MTSDYLAQLQHGLSPVERLNRIVEHAACIGCGICQGVAASGAIAMRTVTSGNPRPVATDALTHEDMDRVLQVCPGTRVDGMPAHLVDADSRHDPVWGVWREIHLAWAAEPQVRHLAATGGLLTGLALYLVESGEVDFVLHATDHHEHPAFGERLVSRNREDVLRGSGSRYGPTATLVDAVEIIARAERDGETFAFIGTPCDVSALRNYARLDPRVDEHCRYMLTMICGGFMEAAGAREVLARFDVDYDEVVSLRYRGHGCPGPTVIKTADGREVRLNYLDYWGEDESTWGLPPRCKVCPDGIGDSADVAAADTWDGGAPPWEGQEDDPGFNAAVVRTRRGLGLMNRAVEAGYIVRGEHKDPAWMNRVQPHQENRKRAVWARFLGLKDAGQVVPDTSGLRIEALYDDNPDAFNREQREGSYARARRGGFSEPAPMVKTPTGVG